MRLPVIYHRCRLNLTGFLALNTERMLDEKAYAVLPPLAGVQSVPIRRRGRTSGLWLMLQTKTAAYLVRASAVFAMSFGFRWHLGVSRSREPVR
jgi:hypothetical protein